MNDTITLTSKVGNFVFDKRVRLSRAKMIRDAILGQYFNPKPNEPSIKTVDDAYSYARDHLSRELESIPFSLFMGKVKG